MNLDKLDLIYNSTLRAEARLDRIELRVRGLEITCALLAAALIGKETLSWLL